MEVKGKLFFEWGLHLSTTPHSFPTESQKGLQLEEGGGNDGKWPLEVRAYLNKGL